jgi:hypothetical protein
MSNSYACEAPKANLRAGQLAGQSRTAEAAKRALARMAAVSVDRPLGRLDGMRRLFRELWPAKASLEFSIATGVSLRHAERVLAGQRGLSLEQAQKLLWSPHGLAVLRELMRGCTETWWADMERALELAELERRIEELRKK